MTYTDHSPLRDIVKSLQSLPEHVAIHDGASKALPCREACATSASCLAAVFLRPKWRGWAQENGMAHQIGTSTRASKAPTCALINVPVCHERSLIALARSSSLISRILTEEAHAITFVKRIRHKSERQDQSNTAEDETYDNNIDAGPEVRGETIGNELCEQAGYSLGIENGSAAQDYQAIKSCRNGTDYSYLAEVLVTSSHVSGAELSSSCTCINPAGIYLSRTSMVKKMTRQKLIQRGKLKPQPSWGYKPRRSTSQGRLELAFGDSRTTACSLDSNQQYVVARRNETAIVVVVANNYVIPGLLVLHQSYLSQTPVPERRPFLVLLRKGHVHANNVGLMQARGIILIPIDPFPVPDWIFERQGRLLTTWLGAFDRVYAWGLTQYKKILILDTDTIIVRNIDQIFEWCSIAALEDQSGEANMAAFLLTPYKEFEQDIQEYLNLAHWELGYGEQGLLKHFFRGIFTYASDRFNMNKFQLDDFADTFAYKDKSTALKDCASVVSAVIKDLGIMIVHYAYDKPWVGSRKPVLIGSQFPS